MPVQRFRLQIDESGRGSLFDEDGRAIEGVVAVTVAARVGHPTRVTIEYLASMEADLEAAEVAVVT